MDRQFQPSLKKCCFLTFWFLFKHDTKLNLQRIFFDQNQLNRFIETKTTLDSYNAVNKFIVSFLKDKPVFSYQVSNYVFLNWWEIFYFFLKTFIFVLFGLKRFLRQLFLRINWRLSAILKTSQRSYEEYFFYSFFFDAPPTTIFN